MAIIKPFRGILYNRDLIGSLCDVVTPPYDVITPRQQSHYYETHPKNFIRIILGRTTRRDSGTDNRYTRAKRYFERWLKEGVLVEDEEPSIYVYTQEYVYKGKRMKRIGFISLAKLPDFFPARQAGVGYLPVQQNSHRPGEERRDLKSFLPHERTFAAPKEDRFKLLKEVKANLSPIFSVFSDDGRKVTALLNGYIKGRKPIIDIEFEKVRHKLWRMTEEDAIAELKRLMADKQALIADGHHRYEVALEFRNAMRRLKGQASDAFDYLMMYFATSDESGLTILPTHRLVEGLTLADFRGKSVKLKEFFDIIPVKSGKRMFSLMEKKARRAFGAYFGRGNYFCLLSKKKAAPEGLKGGHSAYWRNLDVVILHDLILAKAFGIKGEAAERAITFTREPKSAFEWIDAAKGRPRPSAGRAAFFLNPPLFEEIRQIARRHERMPHKTTYFYPKPLSGLVINRLEYNLRAPRACANLRCRYLENQNIL